MSNHKIKKLLIANRGEIARRIALSAKKLDIEVVIILNYGEPFPSPLAGLATSVYEHNDPNQNIYLDRNALVTIAKDFGCDAIHPGFGFLSENEEFAEAVIAAGIHWIGPHPETIKAMASKSEASHLATAAQVPCINSLKGKETNSLAKVKDFCQTEGYPVLIKAAYGGGGKGMRIVRNESELAEQIERAQSEAKNAFGNDEIIIEKYLENPRHIEVQLLGDKHGQVAIIGDRDCSIQRRHQKIIEEAPAPNISKNTRIALHEAARSLGKKVNYENAGTIEFLLDPKTEKFYFLEMNTRLQVEHPVSEEVFGLDLVEWQLKITCNEKLPESLLTPEPQGHAIEARIYAEDVNNNFFPSPGLIYAFNPCYDGNARWELGTAALNYVSEKYDPMIAKVIIKGANRDDAIKKLRHVLEQTLFCGPTSNIEFLLFLLASDVFCGVSFSTQYIDAHLGSLIIELNKRKEQQLANTQNIAQYIEDLFSASKSPVETVTANTITDYAFKGSASPTPRQQSEKFVNLSHNCHFLDDKRIDQGQGLIKGDDGKNSYFCYAFINSLESKKTYILSNGYLYSYEKSKVSEWASSEDGNADDKGIASPVPGKVVKVLAKKDSSITEGDKLFILESMKMEYEVCASQPGRIESVLVQEGQQVEAGQVLAQLQDSDS